ALVNADKMTAVTPEDKAAKEEIIANFYALRALCHFDLLKIYSRIPTAGNPTTDLGVILADKVISVKDQPQRATVQQVYDLIFADLAKAETIPAASATKGWFSINAIKALKARVYLYHGDKVEALKYAKDVIDNGGYSLVAKDKYAASWAFNYNNPEAIMTIICTEDDNSGNEGVGYLMSETGYAAMKVTNSFKALLSADAGDVRSSIIDANDYLKKYPDNLTNVYRIIRLSEMYLIAAEATTVQADAMAYLNVILKARGATEITDATTVDLDRVLLERRKELAGEGHVFFDFMRNKKNIVHTGTDHLATLKDADYVFEYDDYRAIQPIPRNELNSNNVITQNPTYNAR
ncbi:MAG: RagB/SusD family nutrient uptake outer membrane protein, partial [Marinifilaceae bacterium]